MGNKSGYFHLNIQCKFYLKHAFTPPQRIIIVAYRTLTHKLATETGQWPTIPIPKDDKVCTFALTIARGKYVQISHVGLL